jgi:hypothetical protein
MNPEYNEKNPSIQLPDSFVTIILSLMHFAFSPFLKHEYTILQPLSMVSCHEE